VSDPSSLPTPPKPWIAGLLGFVCVPLGMLYVRRPRLAGAYLLVGLVVGLVQMLFLRHLPVLSVLPLAVAIGCSMHAVALSKDAPALTRRPWYSRWYGLTGIFAAFFGVIVLARAFVIEPFRFPSGSMLPTIPEGAHLLVRKWGYGHYDAFGLTLADGTISAPLQRGDMIVFEYPQERDIDYGKRLVGLPGDEVSYVDHVLSINGVDAPVAPVGTYQDRRRLSVVGEYEETLDGQSYHVLFEPTMPSAFPVRRPFPHQEACKPVKGGLTCVVPAGQYFVLGDNRDNSSDSRVWGFVPADHVVGKVVFVTP
jgi:signal peptidase I